MAGKILIDTDVLIDYLHGNEKARRFIESLESPPLISAMTVAELYAGVREGQERAELEGALDIFEIVAVNAPLAAAAGLYRRDFGKSHGVGLMDALIAACAESENATLVTLNRKHFPMLNKVKMPYRK